LAKSLDNLPIPSIGILGGMGPLAGAQLMREVILATKAESDQQHLPILNLCWPQKIEDRTDYILTLEKVQNIKSSVHPIPNPGKTIGLYLHQLSIMGATVAGIACNTTHAPPIMNAIRLIIKELNSKIKIIPLVGETIKHLQKTTPPGSPVGILSTTGTYLAKIYSNPIQNAGYKVVLPQQKSDQEKVHDTIYHPQHGIKTFPNGPWNISIDHLNHAIEDLEERGAKTIILGCTELSLVKKSLRGNSQKLDPLEILAKRLIEEFKKTQRP